MHQKKKNQGRNQKRVKNRKRNRGLVLIWICSVYADDDDLQMINGREIRNINQELQDYWNLEGNKRMGHSFSAPYIEEEATEKKSTPETKSSHLSSLSLYLSLSLCFLFLLSMTVDSVCVCVVCVCVCVCVCGFVCFHAGETTSENTIFEYNINQSI